ncbi:MAG TPA: flagellar hook basal-body protein [Pirellulales bacterium]|jgi:flagellar basal-body rod protein FlgF/flagellar basal-body rod protein FlgG|nr:flagellar hook basal-body protein [Pirellulales bacterium]
MSYGLYISAEGAMAQQARLENLANNLANVSTPGFKRDLAVLQARYAEQTQGGQDYPGSHTQNDLGGGVMVKGTTTDFAPGPIKHTGIPTDMTIEGDGFFVVKHGGQRMLTRAGNFMINNVGQLSTQEGDPVLSEDGEPAMIDPTAGPWDVSPAGIITQGGNTVKLSLVRPHSMGDLVKLGDNLFSPLAEPPKVPEDKRKVMSGYLELSGVKPPLEMIELIETARVFEANVNMVKFHDQMLESIVERVMKS